MILYLDTSSLVKIFVEEDGSQEVRELVDQASWVSTSVVAYPECRSAFARQLREGALTPEEHSLVKASLEENWSELLVLQLTSLLLLRQAVAPGRRAGDCAVKVASKDAGLQTFQRPGSGNHRAASRSLSAAKRSICARVGAASALSRSEAREVSTPATDLAPEGST